MKKILCMFSSRIFVTTLLTSLTCSIAYAKDNYDVKIALQSPLTSVDACLLQTGSTSRVVKLNVYESLTSVDKVKGGVVPLLAESWERLTPQTWRFHLKESVVFHDGTKFDANSVVYSLQRALDPSLSCDPYQRYFANTNVKTKVIDDNTIDITTDPPQPILPTFLESVAMISDKTPRHEMTREPIGTGPYKLVRWDTQRDIKLERFNDYWGEKPKVENATYVWREDSFVRSTMAKLGEVDLSMGIADQHADNPKTDKSFINNDMTRIYIHIDQPPLNDIRVRKALNLALDRQSLIGVLLNPQAKPSAQIVGSSVLGYNKDLKPFPYDPVKAKQLLADARKDGVNVNREILLNAAANDFPNADEVREAFVAMWAEVGLNIKVKSLELSQFRKSMLRPFAPDRQPTMSMTSHDNMTGDAGFSILSKYHSSSYQADIPSKELDLQIEQALLKVDEERRRDFEIIFKKIHEEIIPEIWLYDMASTIRVNPRINYEPTSVSNVILELKDISFN